MAIITYGGGVSAIEGSIGGWTFQSNQSGTIVRLRPIQKKRQTNKQTLIHQELQNNIRAWNMITLAQKTLWNAFAAANDYVNKFGRTTVANGFNWFCALNFYRDLMGSARFVVPPVYAAPGAVIDYTFTLTADAIFFDRNAGFWAINTGVLVFATSYIKRSTAIWRPPMRFITFVASPGLADIIITNEWEVAHGLQYKPAGRPATITIQAMLVPIQKLSAVLGAPVVYQDEQTYP